MMEERPLELLPTPEKTEALETLGQESRRWERSRQDEAGVRGQGTSGLSLLGPLWKVEPGLSLCIVSGRARGPSLSAWKDRPYPEIESPWGGGPHGGGLQGIASVLLGLEEPREGASVGRAGGTEEGVPMVGREESRAIAESWGVWRQRAGQTLAQ